MVCVVMGSVLAKQATVVTNANPAGLSASRGARKGTGETSASFSALAGGRVVVTECALQGNVEMGSARALRGTGTMIARQRALVAQPRPAPATARVVSRPVCADALRVG